ncbi:MAG: alpha/beta hydrolase [Pseudomonadota bacterium]
MNIATDFLPETGISQIVPTTLGRLNVEVRGRGNRIIVLWPSIFADHHIYDALTDVLGASYRMLLIDGPGHGASAGTTKEFTMKACGKGILDVLDHFQITRAIIGGTSWGGLAAAEAAFTAPKRVEALVLMNTPMEISGSRPGLSARMIASGARWATRKPVFQNGVARSFFSAATLQANPDYLRDFHTMLTAANPKTLATAVRSVILRGAPLKPRMKNLPMPVLVIAGKHDEMYPIEVQAEAALLAPHGVFEAVDGKHISAVESPHAVAAILDRFAKTEVVQ